MKKIYFDLETSASLGWVYKKWEANVLKFEKESHLLSVAYWVEGEKTIHVVTLADFPHYKRDIESDEDLAKFLWKLFDGADILVAHNGDKFDIPYANTRFAKWKLPPPSPYVSIDTLKWARKYFRFLGNTLDECAEFFGVGRKIKDAGFDLFLACDNGDMKAWKRLRKYNKQDVFLLRGIYEAMKPWVAPKKTSVKNGICPNTDCGKETLQKRGTEIRAGGFLHQRLVCTTCGRWCYGGILNK